MKTTTTMTPATEATTAPGPSLWSRAGPLSWVGAAAGAPARGGVAATITGIAPWAGAVGTAISPSRAAKRAVTVAMTGRRRHGPAARRRSGERIGALPRPEGVPVLLQLRITVHIMLRAADALPAPQKRLLSESGMLCGSL